LVGHLTKIIIGRVSAKKTACNIASVVAQYNQLQNAISWRVPMAGGDKADIIRAVFAGYLANDRAAVEDAPAGDFRFTSPYDDEIDKATYFERCWRGSDWIERHELEKIMVEGDEAFVTYRCVAKGGRSFRNTECFRFVGDRIQRIDVYFGATYQDAVFVRQSES
jgi:hypothetical protein